jgi:pimeloyl-ACP methyl ester carboxylesterase
MNRSTAALLVLTLLAGGCGLKDVRPQQALLDAACLIEGTVASAGGAEVRPLVVVLAGRAPASTPAQPWAIVDHFVLESAGRWIFVTKPGEYRLAAFEDRNRDLVYQPGEPMVRMPPGKTVTCATGGRVKDIALEIPAVATDRLDADIDIAALQARSLEGQVGTTMGQLTAVGEIAKLSDARFAHAVSESGLWRPFDFIVAGYGGVYFLERDDPKKIPVLFVHGVNGTPASFGPLIERMDRTRFQPWLYYYPSGVHLAGIADHLAQTVAKLQRSYPHDRIIVVAHSMGGLVSRGFIQRHAKSDGPPKIALFVSISTPWDGHRAAEIGVKHAPAVVRIWEDMVPGSAYIKDVFARPLPVEMPHHLLFTFSRDSVSFGVSDDRAVTVASQLGRAAQAGATRIYGFDDTHVGVLTNPDVSVLVNRLLETVR